MNMQINKAGSYLNAIRIEPRQLNNEERIKNNDKEIAKLESEISIRENNINITEKLFESSNRKISILEQLKSNNDELLGTHKEQRGLLQESRDLTKESRDLTKESRDLMQKMINIMEKMEAIMMKNPAKYGGLPSFEVQKLPEVIAAKSQVVAIAAVKVEQYPKEESMALTDTVKNVVDATFTEIKPTDVKANMKLFNNLEKRIEAALDRKHETLAVRDQGIRHIMNAHYKSIEQFSRIKKLDYLDLALKNIEV